MICIQEADALLSVIMDRLKDEPLYATTELEEDLREVRRLLFSFTDTSNGN